MSSEKHYLATAPRTEARAVSLATYVLADRVSWIQIDRLTAIPRNTRHHSREQIHMLANTLKTLGTFVPIIVDEKNMVMAGHGRLEAARYLKLESVPTLVASGLSEAEKRAFVIADNRLAEKATWDREALRAEFQELVEINFDVELTGFNTGQVDILLDQPASSSNDDGFTAPSEDGVATTQAGDLWLLGSHRLLCGDSRKSESYAMVLGDRKANLIFADPPYNVPIAGHVSGLGQVRHREFAMGSGEMSERAFQRFLSDVFTLLADNSTRGSIHFICMDWRHLSEVLNAGHEVYSELKNLCVWNKNNAGMGSLYRSKHELILVFQNGRGRFTNNVSLGANGRYRTNVWDYPGMSSQHTGRDDALAMHPTVKPVALVADPIRDCSKRGALVLDPFSGSGTTILAAHKAGRHAAAIEIDPLYVDVAIERWQKVAGLEATLASTGVTFKQTRAARR